MLSLSTIQTMSMEAAIVAAEQKKSPFVPWGFSEIENKNFRIPNIGDYIPDGWELIDNWLVDSSGFGTTYEPALTMQQFKQKIISNLHHNYGYATIEVGQFQVVVGVFKVK